MIEQDAHKTAVVFRKLGKRNGGGIIALFPEIPCDAYRFYCMSNEHVGQFGGADYNGVIARTFPATEEEYAALKKELERVGYNLRVYRRQTAKMLERRRGRALHE